MQQYNFLQAIYMSFYSKKLYRDVANNWGGKTFFYLLMLVIISAAVYSYITQNLIKEGYQYYSAQLAPQIPSLTFKNGKLSTPENRPYFIVNPNNKENLAVIDTSGQYTSAEQAQTSLLITQTQAITHSDNQSKTYTFPEDFNSEVTPGTIDYFIERLLGYTWIIFFIVFIFFFYIYRIFQALIYALIGKIFASLFRVQIAYGQIVQIMMVAITPVIILSAIQHIFLIKLNHEMLIYFLLAMLYLFYGIMANKKLS